MSTGVPGSSCRRVIAALAIAGMGALTACSGGGGISGGPAHDGPQAVEIGYLNSLDSVALAVRDAVLPADHVIQAFDAPHVGDSFSARDAFAHGDALPHLKAASKRLNALQAPSTFAPQHKALAAAATKMSTALVALHGLGSLENNARLTAKIDEIGQGDLEGAEGDWDTALKAVYKLANQHAPADFGSHKPRPTASRTGWIFGADRSCEQSAYILISLVRLAKDHSLPVTEHRDRLIAKSFRYLGDHLTKLPRPHHSSALPRLLTSRLRVISFEGRLFKQEVAGLEHRDVSVITRVADRLKESLPTFRNVSRQLRAYGAVACGDFTANVTGLHTAGGHGTLAT